ncbi:hypothetical protein [Pseudonocardia sp. GCM10023141]|uniref:hypothetical protein n=1 Tax=Pseudonocardia sp. GCM10023141 TaxID=3252653 RepID=UPI0036132A15
MSRQDVLVTPHWAEQNLDTDGVVFLEARLNMYRWHARHLFEEVTLRAEQHVPTLDLLDVTPEQAARFVRAQWRMPAAPGAAPGSMARGRRVSAGRRGLRHRPGGRALAVGG